MIKFNGEGKTSYLDICCRLGLAVMFLVAGLPKMFHPYVFANSVEAYGILPDFLILPAAITLPIIEVVLAVALIRNRKEGLWGSIALLLIFIAALGYAIYMGLDIDCGCFGPEDPEGHAFSNIHEAIVRDVVFVVMAIIPLCIHKFSKETGVVSLRS